MGKVPLLPHSINMDLPGEGGGGAVGNAQGRETANTPAITMSTFLSQVGHVQPTDKQCGRNIGVCTLR